MDQYIIVLIVAVIFCGYKLEKLHDMLIDWRMDWEKVTGFDQIKDDL